MLKIIYLSYSLSLHHGFRITIVAHNLNITSRHNRNPLFSSHNAQSQDVAICLFLLITICTLHAFVVDPFTRHLIHVHIYLYVLRKSCLTCKDRGVFGYPTQDYPCNIPSKKYQKIFLGEFPAKSFPLFL